MFLLKPKTSIELNPSSKMKTQGFTLIEVLVSWFLLSVALLALLKLDQTSLVSSRAALIQAVAQSQFDNGLALLALQDSGAFALWQANLNEVLPQAQVLLTLPSQLTLSWQTPESNAPMWLSHI
jgi:prepilin-type N-terminal cleavage/methylation domain-containing protein